DSLIRILYKVNDFTLDSHDLHKGIGEKFSKETKSYMNGLSKLGIYRSFSSEVKKTIGNDSS
ncbi:MAG: hypothetical protein RSD94_17270, partial [Acinetobacter sp.]